MDLLSCRRRGNVGFITVAVFVVLSTLLHMYVLQHLRNQPGIHIVTAGAHTPKKTEQNWVDENMFPNCTESYKSQHLITIFYKENAGLGNLFFQMATLLSTARVLCRAAVLPDMFVKELNMFNLSAAEISIKSNRTNWKTFKEKFAMTYTPEILKISVSSDWALDGYFQSWKYFGFAENYLKRVFTFRQNVTESAQSFLDSCIDPVCRWPNSLKVGIHVRRTDFLKKVNVLLGYTVASADYINKSMDTFRSRFPNNELCFIVASDDIKWCTENIMGPNVYFSNLTTAGEDLALLSLCDHSIVTVGTFGWLAAWLTGGLTTYYSSYPKPGTFLYNSTVHGDYFMPSWLGLS